MSREMQIFHVYGKRPTEARSSRPLPQGGFTADIPAGWLIFNAPRPLDASEIPGGGYLSWQSDFRHGIFYTAVDPQDLRAVENNVSLDGWVLEFHELAEIRAEFEAECNRRNVPAAERADFDDDQKIDWFFAIRNRGVR